MVVDSTTDAGRPCQGLVILSGYTENYIHNLPTSKGYSTLLAQ